MQADRTAFVAPVVLKPVSDPRLRRLAERQREAAEESDDSDDGRDRRRAASRRHASIAAQAEEAAASGDESREDESGSEEEANERDEEDIATRRAAVKARCHSYVYFRIQRINDIREFDHCREGSPANPPGMLDTFMCCQIPGLPALVS